MRVNFTRLKWLTIITPIGFLALLGYLAVFVFRDFFLSGAGYGTILGIAAAAVFLFSQFVFGIITRLQQQVLRQNRELSALSEVAIALSRAQALDECLQVALDTVLRAFNLNAGIICLLEQEREELVASAHRGLSPALVAQVKRQKLGDEPLGTTAVRERRTVMIANAFEDPQMGDLARREGLYSLASIPLLSQGISVGVLGIASAKPRSFSRSDLQLLERIAGQIGIAVEKAKLFDELERRNRELRALNEVSSALSSTLDLRQVMGIAMDEVLEAIGAQRAELWLAVEGSNALRLAAWSGVPLPELEMGAEPPPDDGLRTQVARTGVPVYCVEERPSAAIGPDRAAEVAMPHILGCLPLISGRTPLGVLCILGHDGPSLGGREREMLQSIASQSGVAIRNAQLYEQVQALAILEERDRIAREMHDGLAQVLGYVNTKAFAVRKLLEQGDLAAAEGYLAELEEAAREVYADVREGVLSLRSTAPSDRPLVASVCDYLDKFSRLSGTPIECQAGPDVAELRLPIAIEIQLMRIVQEALNNVRKHANASRAIVVLARADNRLAVSVEDDGKGFDMADRSRSEWPRFGLQTMRERADSVRGTFEIVSRPGQGTRVSVTVPLTEATEGTGIR